jgi:acyl-CoA thioesterase FadM
LGLVLRNIQINIKSQVEMFDNLDVELETSDISKYRFNFIYTFKRDGKTIATGSTEMVYIDLATKRLIAIPEDQVKLLKSIEKENA